MKKNLLKTVLAAGLCLSFALSSSFGSPTNPNQWKEWISEMEEADSHRYENSYEPTDPKIFTEKRGGSLIPQDAREWIRPEETEHLLSQINLDRLSFEEKIEKIYRFLKTNFKFDSAEESDFWQYPAETIKRGKGDCEDMAFLVKSLLLAAGIPDEMVFVNIKYWHVYATALIDGKIKVLEFDPDTTHYYSYEWPKYRFNLSVFEQRKRRPK